MSGPKRACRRARQGLQSDAGQPGSDGRREAGLPNEVAHLVRPIPYRVAMFPMSTMMSLSATTVAFLRVAVEMLTGLMVPGSLTMTHAAKRVSRVVSQSQGENGKRSQQG